MTRIRFEWRESVPNPDPDGPMGHLAYVPGDERDLEVEWPSVPRVGEHVEVSPDGEGRTVAMVLWGIDGTAVVRLG